MTDEELIVDLNRLFWLLEEDRQYLPRANTVRLAARRISAQAAEIERLEKACAEWAEVSQSNYQRAKAAEAKLAKAVEALEEIATDEHPLGWIAIAALAEIKGAKP